MTDIPEPGRLEVMLSEHGRLLALARTLLRDEHAAEDVVQDALLQSWSTGRSGGTGLRALLRRMVRHRALDRRKTDQRRQTRETHVAKPAAVPSANEMLLREQLRRHVAEAVMELDAPYRAAVWLRYFEGLPAREVADRLAVPLDTVRTRLRRALDQLRGKLDERYGDRGAWAAVLMPVIGTAATSVLGGLLIMKKAHLALLASGVLLVSVAAWAWAGADAMPPVEGDRVMGLVAELSPPEASADSVAVRREVPAAASSGTGTLLHADGTPAAGVPFWSWGDRQPRWTQRPEAPVLSYPSPVLPEPHGHTDDRGAFALEDSQAITFQPAEGIRTTFETAARDGRFVLPELAEVVLLVEGASDTDSWEALVYAAVPAADLDPADPDFGSHLVESISTGNGPVTLSLISTRARLSGEEELRVPAVAGHDYFVNAWGESFLMQPNNYPISAPGLMRHAYIRPNRVLDMELVDQTGRRVARDGWVWAWKAGVLGASASLLELGIAHLPSDYPPGTEHALGVILATGELFQDRFVFEPDEFNKRISFVVGQGRPPVRLRVPEGLREEDTSEYSGIVIEGPDGRLSSGWPLSRQWLDWDYPSDFAWTLSGSGELLLARAPEGWRQAWIILSDGRVAHATRSPSGAGEALWMPDSAIEEVSVRDQLFTRGEPERASLGFFVELVGSAGDRRWFPVDRFQYDIYRFETWDELPIWNKRAPLTLNFQMRRSVDGPWEFFYPGRR